MGDGVIGRPEACKIWARPKAHTQKSLAVVTDEVNPWLRRTGWIPYLEGCERKDILRCLREPTVDEEIAEGENEANNPKMSNRARTHSIQPAYKFR